MPIVRRGGDSGIPAIAAGDALKVIRVKTDETGLELAAVPVELPAIEEGDESKVLAVKSDGSGVEYVDLPADELPTPTEGDAGKVLAVNAEETGMELVDPPSGLPEITEGDSGKFLSVKVDESGYELTTPPTLQTASAETLGVVKVGTGLSITDGVLSATGGTSASVVEFTDPARLWYGASGISFASAGNNRCGGDPCVVWDGTQWVVIYWLVTVNPTTSCYYKTAPTLDGPWSSATAISALATYHKPFVLVDEDGSPVLADEKYHIYASLWDGDPEDKEIYHFTATSLTGTWTLDTKVLAKGASGTKDECFADTPFALYKDGTVYLWYMGAPSGSDATYGYATRILRATASAPGGTFTKDYDDVILPATSAAWDYGWMGGVQIRKRPNGKYLMVYNAGDTRAESAGNEPNTSRVGYAYADSLDGPWTKDSANPYLTPTGVPSDAGQTLESTNIWRGYIAFDPAIQRWFMFYNTGESGDTNGEVITYGREGLYDYFDAHAGAPYDIQDITTSVVAVANSRVNLTPGIYRVHYQFNVGHLHTSTPHLDIDVALRINGTAYRTNREFVGNFNYENFDTILDYIVSIPSTGYVDCTVQCTAGTPVSGQTKIRRLRVNVQRIR